MADTLKELVVDDATAWRRWLSREHERTRDRESYRQRFTPRRPGSTWSARNVQRIERLEREGRMHASGRAAVERARADGNWNQAYASPSKATVPEDLAKALKEDAKASAMSPGLSCGAAG
jgi:uncharacterized protein YdeI (YjbR/CyaY-like superfamily)